MCKEFLLHKIAKLDNGNKFDKNKMTHNNPCYNFVSRTATNNGISDYVDDNGTEPYPAGTITLAFGGSIGSTFVQPKPYYTGQNVGVITLPDNVSEEAKVYFAISLEKMCKCKYVAFADEINKHFKTDLTVVLPVIENSNPDHEYTVDDIDWEYMRDRITELERDRITELDAYLQATGLNDYELTDEDKKTLSLSAKRASDENGTLEDNSEDEVRFGEFRVDEIFEVVGTKSLDAGAVEFKDTGINFVGRTYENNGVQGKIDKQAYAPNDANTITATVIGNYKYVKYQEEPYYCSQNINKLTLLDTFGYTLNRLSADYLITVIRKFVEQYNGQQGGYKLSELKGYKMLLPIKSDGTPDFEYMERYIRAMEKVVIADVVKYKDKVI